MDKIQNKKTKITFYYESYDVNYKHNILNSVDFYWNGLRTLDDYIQSIIESLCLVKKNVFQYAVYEVVETLVKSCSIDEGVITNEI